MSKKIDYTFKIDGFYENTNYYRSETPMDVNAMPAPVSTGITGLTYTDETAEVGKTYYVRFGSLKNGNEKLSNEITISIAEPGSRYWRVRITQNNDSPYISIGEIFLVSGSSDLVTSGKIYNQSSKGGAKGAEACFDGIVNGSAYWYTAAANMPAWVSIDMGGPAIVDRVDIAMSTSAGLREAPKSFEIQKSVDGVTWVTVKEFTNQISWTLGTRRQFIL